MESLPHKNRVLVGLIGANIMNSLSPTLFSEAFAAAGIDGFYHLMDVDRLPGRPLADLLDAARTAGFAGVNITYPFKQEVMALLDVVNPGAREVAAVNAVAFDQVGNRSNPFSLAVAVQPNAPPIVTLSNNSGSNTVGQSQAVTFDVHATDDDRLAQT